jgi:hypothetical protein
MNDWRSAFIRRLLEMSESSYLFARQLCGLSQDEAAAFHGVHVDEIKAWDLNTRPASISAWQDLRGLFQQIAVMAEEEALEIAKGDISPAFHRRCPEIDRLHDPLPFAGARKAAGVMALLGAISLKQDEAWEGNQFLVAS